MPSTSPHFVFFPLMAQGHMIPALDLARLLAQRGATISIFTTPHNATRFQKLLARANHSGLQIQLILLDFQILEASGLPHGCENMDQLPSNSFHLAYFFLVWLADLLPQAQELMRKLTPPPTCIIADLHLPWTADIARTFNVPWIALHTGCCFCQVICEKKEKPTDDFFKQVEKTKKEAYGMIVNSFEELEAASVKEYENILGRKIWCVGPVSFCNTDINDKAERGNQIGSNSDHHCFKWLDSQTPASVLYVCLGSLCNLPAAELIELGLGLEASKKPFIWILRVGIGSDEVNKWISEVSYEERIQGRGLVVRGWAPQLLILSHSSIGGFLTHCGWNSVLEGIGAGLPMITLPLFGDQYCNEKLVVEELKIAVKSGKGETSEVRRERVVEAVEELMGEGDEARERKKRAGEVGKMANQAMGEGGSSQLNISLLIEDIEQYTQSCDLRNQTDS